MTTTAATTTMSMPAFTAAVKAVAGGCDRPTLATLTTTGGAVTGRGETQPPVAVFDPDVIGATLAGMARLVGRFPDMCDDVAGYAVILPGQRVAVAVDRDGRRYSIQLPGAPTEALQPRQWDTATTGLTAMITAIAG